MPGGKMTLNTGLMALTRMDEHKLATVLGHEIAHALLEHGRASIGRSAVVLGTLQAMAQSFKMGQLRLNTLVEGMERVTLPLEREHEREADLLGMQLMTRAGYDPVRGASIWIDMKGDEPAPRLAQRLEPYVSSHPTSDERLTNLTEIARMLAPGGPAR
jgi:predicted Zn-dependent protease